MPTDLPPSFSPQRPQRKGKNFLPEILVAGVIFGAGAWFWSQNLTPAIPIAPEMRVAQAQEEAPANWKEAPEKEQQAAQKVIVAQLEAFKIDDYKEAEKYQSSGLKGSFGSTEQFRQVIKQNYPQFANYKAVKWGKARIDGPLFQIQIVIVGQDDAEIAALYSMVKEKVTDDKGKTTLEYRVSGVTGGSMQIGDTQVV